MPALKKHSKVYVAGHRGLVGSAVCRALAREGFSNVLVRDRKELDLLDQRATYDFLKNEKPDVVIAAAAKVGGIHANRTMPAEFIAENVSIESNLIWGSHLADVPNLLFLGSSCMYPREASQPIPESALLSGPLEPTNEPYAVAKIAGLVMCVSISRQFGRNYFTVVPPNVYGQGDNFHPEHSHVIGALVRRFHECLPDKPVVCWGTGTPKREFLHSQDVADACLFLLGQDRVAGHVNVGTGHSVSIMDLAFMIQQTVGHSGEISWDKSMPDGFPEKTMDVSRISEMGWRPQISLESGLQDEYASFLGQLEKAQ